MGFDFFGDLNLGIYVLGEFFLNLILGIGVYFDIDDMMFSVCNEWSVGVNG